MRRRLPGKISIRTNLALKLPVMPDAFAGLKKPKALPNPNPHHPKVVLPQLHKPQLVSESILTFAKIIA
jgi:hypothetical protein